MSLLLFESIQQVPVGIDFVCVFVVLSRFSFLMKTLRRHGNMENSN
jgi:hypothetical protein